MHKALFSIVLTVGLSFVFVGSALAADYDGDGRDDLEVVSVSRNSSNGGSTKWYIKRSKTGKSLTYSFSVPGAALIRVKRSNRKNYPGVVYVQSISEPLKWQVKSSGPEERFDFGVPGDTIPNQGDLDGDGITDYVIVRNRSDNKLEWIAKMSAQGGAEQSVIFGSVGERAMVGPDRMLITLDNDFNWRGRTFSNETLTLNQQWGVVGDIPLAPVRSGQVVVARLIGSKQTLFSKLADLSVQQLTLGGKGTIPTMGNFYSGTLSFGYHDRSKGRVYLRNPSTKKFSSVKFGSSKNAIVLPSGQVIQPGDNGYFGTTPPSGGSNGGGNSGGTTPTNPGLSAVCPSVRSATGGEIWKSIASTHIPTSDPRRFSTSFITRKGTGAPSTNCLELYDSRGNLIHKLGRYSPTGSAYSSRSYGGSGCGDKKRASDVAAQARQNTGSIEGYLKVNPSECVRIPDPNSCVNSSAC